MLIKIGANLAIILVNFYVLIKLYNRKLSYGLLPRRKKGKKLLAMLIAIQTIVGLFMLATAPVIFGVRFDFRIILYIMMNKYLGHRVTIPTIFILSFARLFFESNLSLPLNFIFAVYLMMTLPTFFEWSKKHFNELGQLIVVNNIYLLTLIPFYYLRLAHWRDVVVVGTVVLLASFGFIYIINYVVSDIEKLFALAMRDSLSKLFNTRQLQGDLVSFSSKPTQYGLLIIDIDDFKLYNDTYGHLVGDDVIRQFSRTLSDVVDGAHPAYRYGGEEFVVIIEDKTGKLALDLAQTIQDKVRQLIIGPESLKLTVSIGVAHRFAGESLMKTFSRADQAMYFAKANGKNQISMS